MVQGSESASITPNSPTDGLTGSLTPGLTININGVNVGLGITHSVSYANNSTYETRPVEGGWQEKRYVVDLEVTIYVSLMAGGELLKREVGSTSIKKYGAWYE